MPGDYDGDDAVDIAVFRPSTGTWLVRNGATVTLGQAGDIPVPADYNGDGRTDMAVFRPSNGTWYVQGQAPVAFGAAGDIPMAFDVDYDGAAEFCYFRPAAATWGTFGRGDHHFGLPGDIPMLVDATTDNDYGHVVYRPGNSNWYSFHIHYDEAATLPFGEVGDVPVFQPPSLLLGSMPLLTTVLHDASHSVIWNDLALAGARGARPNHRYRSVGNADRHRHLRVVHRGAVRDAALAAAQPCPWTRHGVRAPQRDGGGRERMDSCDAGAILG